MKKNTLVCLILCLLGATFTTAQPSRAWKYIFNGKDLSGWSVVGSKGKITVQDSAMVCQMTANTPEHTFARTNTTYGDFILELDCLRDSSFNTGILFRCIDAPRMDTTTVSLYGYQVKIDPSTKRRWTGGIFDDFGRTWHWLYTLAGDDRARSANKTGDWNHFRVEAIGNVIKVWVNGIPTTHMRNGKYTNGYIALKIHSLGDKPEQEQWSARFRNIRIISKNPEKYAQPMDIPIRAVD